MSKDSIYTVSQLTVGSVLNRTAKVTRKNPLLFLYLVLILALSFLIVYISDNINAFDFINIESEPLKPEDELPFYYRTTIYEQYILLLAAVFVLKLIISFIISTLTQSCMSYGTYKTISGNYTSFVNVIKSGTNPFIYIISTSIFFIIIVVLYPTFLTLLYASMLYILYIYTPYAIIKLLMFTKITFGFAIIMYLLILFVPCILLYCIFSLSIPVCVVEKIGPIASLKRSAHITKGHRITIFGIFVVLFFIFLVAYIAILYVTNLFFGSEPISNILGNILYIIFQSYSYLVIAVIYYDLRTIKEGTALDSMANVFD